MHRACSHAAPRRVASGESRRRHLLCSASQPATISSTSNEWVKHAVKLRTSSKYREEQAAVLLVSAGVLAEVAQASAETLRLRVLMLAEGASAPPGMVADRVLVASRDVLRKVAGVESADGLTAVAELAAPRLAQPAAAQARAAQRVLVLDGVQDPGNLGTLLRSALAFGFDACLLLPGCCDPFNGKALAASRGAAFRLPLWRGPAWPELAELAAGAGALLLGADPRGDASGAALRRAAAGGAPVWLVLGAEGPGLSDGAQRLCSLVAVPGASGIESLNVAVAGSILMYECCRPQQQ